MYEMIGHYNPFLVSGSIAISITASYITLLLIKRMVQSKTKSHRYSWLTAGSLTFGGGIWSMHFVAMLAYEMDMTVQYHPWLLLISILCAVLASFVAFLILKKRWFKRKSVYGGTIFISLGILSMHYIGMEAMQMNAAIEYDALLFAASVVIAVLTSFVALKIFMSLLNEKSQHQMRHLVSALLMGAAISGMHYTGMAAADFVMVPSSLSNELGDSLVDAGTVGYVITGAIGIVFLFLLAMIQMDRRREKAEQQFSLTDQVYRSIVQAANDAMIMADEKGNVLTWNKAAEKIFGYSKKEMLQKPLTQIMPEQYREGHQHGIMRYLETKEKRVIGKTVEVEGLHKNGSTFPIELSLSVVENEGLTYFSSIIRDISERKASEEKIETLVYRDDLTYLPNRRMLNEHLAATIQSSRRNEQNIGVAFIDMDRFKQVNDVYGHKTGDELLIAMAERIKGCVDENGLLARQSGDEFVIVQPHSTPYEMGSVTKTILKAFQQPFCFKNRKLEIVMSPSIGVSMYPEDGETAGDLIKNADVAMYQAKQLGGNQSLFFTSEINETISRKMKLESGLRKAASRGELENYYQPQVSVQTGKLKGMEVLIRWNHPELGQVPPNDFIPLAEETNLIIPIGEWVLREACRQYVAWREAGFYFEHISVNISAVQFRHPDFTEMVEKVIEETGMNPKHLVLEITETVVQEVDKAIPILNELKGMGILLSLDDFGTGYSSLQYLKEFPLDALKIDKSFIQTLDVSERDEAVVEMIISMAEKLGLSIVAEGVETDRQLRYLSRRQSVDYQGFLYSPPLPSAEVMRKFLESDVG
ncbi:bifunctional diguanylate cyclase/phosphodiesterase [Halobacillus fulvus]|nr:bifunctional diguanylate cyclase/phosphodiesterase [Halobacillus fulvus]